MSIDLTALGNNSSLLYRFLVSPKLRWLRYTCMLLVLCTISFNQVFILFVNLRDALGYWIYVLTFIYLFSYVLAVYWNLFWLFPHYLLKRKYLKYLSHLSLAMAAVLLMQMALEYAVYQHWSYLYPRKFFFDLATIMDYVSSFLLTTLCVVGGTVTLLLKAWMMDFQRVAQMEKAHVLSEVEQLKEQISPELKLYIYPAVSQQQIPVEHLKC